MIRSRYSGLAANRSRRLSAGGQLEQPWEVKSSTTTAWVRGSEAPEQHTRTMEHSASAATRQVFMAILGVETDGATG